MIKTIVCTGDSHTWGQGASDATQSFHPPVEGGDLRLLPFGYGSYVNLLRRMIEKTTGSASFEFSADQIAEALNLPLHDGCVRVDDSMKLELDAALIRIEFRKLQTPSVVSVFVDGILQKKVNLQSDNVNYGFYGMETIGIFVNTTPCTLEIKSEIGNVLVYRIEAYRGEYAVINSGIGSCPTFRYMEEYWADYVEDYRPAIVLIEAHTINDWLAGGSPVEYEQNLVRYIKKIKKLNAIPVLLTVSPVMGSQNAPYNKFSYGEFIDASRRAAQSEGIDIADANHEMKQHLNKLTESEQERLMFSDNWHVNDFGHSIYAQCAIKKINL